MHAVVLLQSPISVASIPNNRDEIEQSTHDDIDVGFDDHRQNSSDDDDEKWRDEEIENLTV